jgi:hypothetical protein
VNTIKIGLAAVAALSLSLGMALAQEGPGNDTETGTTWPPPVVPGAVQSHAQPGMVQSGSSDAQTQPTTTTTTTTGRPFWTPGVAD